MKEVILMGNSIINIIMAINEKYIMPTRVTIASVKANRKDENINIYILHFNISSGGVNLLESDSTDNVKIKCIQIDEKKIPDIKTYYHFSKEIMIKLFTQDILNVGIDKVIWLDSDVIVLKSLLEFYNYDISKKYFIAYEDQKVKDEYLKKINFDINKRYLCVGVMLINLDEIRKNEHYKKDIIECIENNYDVFEYTEQDVVNKLYYEKSTVLVFPYKYNRFVDTIHSNEINEQNISVLHYEGPHQKPWKGCACRHYMLWWKYARTIKEYRPLFWKIMPTYIKNYIKKIFVKIRLILGINKKKISKIM